MGLLGGNLLNRASRLIPKATVSYGRWLSNSKNTVGVIVPLYAAVQSRFVQVQPIARTMYEALGLDLQRNYIAVFADFPLRDLKRNGSCDTIDYCGRRYNVESNTDWFGQDGWVASICVDVGATSEC